MMTSFPTRSCDVPDLSFPCELAQAARAEATLRELLAAETDEARGLEIQTLIARTQALQGDLPRAQDTLVKVAKHLPAHAGTAVEVRYLLEHGRIMTLMRTPSRAQPMFAKAWNGAMQLGDTFLAIDAAQMLAIVEPPKTRAEWINRGLELALGSEDSRVSRWRGALQQALGWHYFDLIQFDKALESFETAVESMKETGEAPRSLEARYAIGRTLRALKRFPEALAVQQAIAVELGRNENARALVNEEIAECFYALKQQDEAQRHFALAHQVLAKDQWLADNEPSRLLRLKKLAKPAMIRA